MSVMNSRHFNEQELTKLTMYEIVSELIKLGAPLKLKSLTKIDIEQNDFEILGNFEQHPDCKGGITYMWGSGDWFE